MRISRKLRALLGLLMAFTLLAAACGDDSDSSSSDTTAADGGSDEEATTVGLAFDLGGRGDQSFNDSAVRGLDQASEEFSIDANELEPDEGGENRAELLQLLCDDGSQLIFGIGGLYTETLTAVAEGCPDSTFGIVDSVVDLPNVASLHFAEEEGSFLVGAAAALTTQTDHVGFIGGVNFDLIQKFQAGFEAGVAAIDPAIAVDVSYLTEPPDFAGFNDPARGKEVAEQMYSDGADVVYHAAGGSGAGVFEAAVEARAGGDEVWAIGVDSDQYEQYPDDPEVQDVILTSMVKSVDQAVYETIANFVNGEEVGGTDTLYNLENGGISYATSGDHMPQEVIDQLEDLKAQIIAGEIEIPTVPEG